MTDERKRSRLAHEILGLIGVSALIALVVFLLLTNIAATVAEVYCFENDVPMTEFDWMAVDRWIVGAGTVLSVAVFSILFLVLLADRITYIRTITQGIDGLGRGERHKIPLEGNNELTQLAAAINEISQAQRRLREKEQALAEEKEQFIRTLSHDIRTPLTSILAYSDYLASKEDVSPEEQKTQLKLIQKKAQQIRQLTDILLDGSKRKPEHFDDANLLMQQLAAEFEEGLEEQFQVVTDLSGCRAFAGRFDVQELRRIFDNLSSNIQKYADPVQPVSLIIRAGEEGVQILQSNAVLSDALQPDSHQLGLHSIRRIAQHYGGGVTVEENSEKFQISVILSEIL